MVFTDSSVHTNENKNGYSQKLGETASYGVNPK